MIKLSRNILKSVPLYLLGILFYMVILNWITFGADYFTDPGKGLLTSGMSFFVILLVFQLCRYIIVVLRNRFPSDEEFNKRVLIQVTVFILLTAVSLVGLFSLYKRMGWVGSNHENNLTWAFIATGMMCIFLSFLNEAINVLERWQTGLQETEQLKRAYTQGQLVGLKSQINPHVLFNSLNSLSELIHEDTEKAESFLDEMSKVYRYMLRNEEESLVTLETELQFINSYFSLLKARYNEGIELKIEVSQESKQGKLPPLSLQIVLENALFQNKISKEAPLVFKIQSMNGGLIVVNNIQPKLMTDAGDIDSGLDILVKKYQLMNQPSVEIIEEGNQRMVVLPFVNLISENPS